MNNKTYNLYLNILESLKNILSQNNIYNLNILTITTDAEPALINAINTIIPKINRFNCYFNFKQDLILKLRKNGFWKRKKKGTSVNSKNKFPNID